MNSINIARKTFNYSGGCSKPLLEKNSFGVKWNTSESFSSNTGSDRLPMITNTSSLTYWRSKELPGWFLIYFETTITCSYFVLGSRSPHVYMRSFTLTYSIDYLAWENATYFDGSRVFPASVGLMTRSYSFQTPIKTRYLRFDAVSYSTAPAAAVEIYGCIEIIRDCSSVPSPSPTTKCFNNWNIIGQKFSDEESSVKLWTQYKDGFVTTTESWAGNDIISKISTFRPYSLRIDMWSPTNEHIYAEYATFILSNEKDNYKATISRYNSGTATAGNFLGVLYFISPDHDNPKGCASKNKTGFWSAENKCPLSYLTGLNSTWSVKKTYFNPLKNFPVAKYIMRIKTIDPRK